MNQPILKNTMKKEKGILNDGTVRAPALERPESGDPRIVRCAARFFALAADEKLTPYEQAVAWQRIARTIMREALYKLAVGSMLGTLAREVIAELPPVAREGGRNEVKEEGRDA